MIIAVVSDSHDNIWNLRKSIEIMRVEHTEGMIHCGDFVAPFMLKELETAEIPVHGVFGNNDGDQHLLTRLTLTTLHNITLHGLIGKTDLGGKKICFTHYEEVAKGLGRSGDFDLVCFGHSHIYTKEKAGETILLNPGEIMGKDGSPGFCLVDTKNMEIKRIELPVGG